MLAMPSKTRNQFDLIRFLDQLDDEVPIVEDQQIVAITDNLSTRGTENVNRWLEAHPRWSFQFLPKHASWLNQVEIFFSILWRRLLKHGIFTSEQDLALTRARSANRAAESYAHRSSGWQARLPCRLIARRP